MNLENLTTEQLDYYKRVLEFKNSPHYNTFSEMCNSVSPSVIGILGASEYETIISAAKYQYYRECITDMYNETDKAAAILSSIAPNEE